MSPWNRIANALGPADEAAWQRFVRAFVLCLGGGLLVIYLALIAIDPYDTGRFPTFMPAGIPDEHQYINSASRGRNPDFNAAIFGNSHGQLLSPIRLSQATNLKFIQMTSPGSGPREQTTFMRYFLRHHPDAQAMVLAADQRWCTRDATLPPLYQFSPWLFEESNLPYLLHLLNSRAIVAARKRVMMALGRAAPYEPAGYWDYESGKPWTFDPAVDDQPPRGVASAPDADHLFPALAALDQVIAQLPSALPLVIVMPPQFYLLLPDSGSAAANELAACKAALASRVAGRARSGFLDYLQDSPVARNPQNFMDWDHYRLPIAQQIEAQTAAILAGNSPAE